MNTLSNGACTTPTPPEPLHPLISKDRPLTQFRRQRGRAPNDQEISELDAAGTNSSFINSGDLIELGFFDTDNTNSHTPDGTDQSALYSPNTSSSTLFRGI